MELLESVGPRSRQARYQAALRPDKRQLDSSVPRLVLLFPKTEPKRALLPFSMILRGQAAGRR